MRNQTIARWLAVSVVLMLFGCNRSGPSSNSTNSNGNPASNAAQTPPPPPAPPVVIPAGTLLAVTLDETISTKTNNSGDRFAASLAEPVTLDGNQVIPAGTKAVGTVVQAQAAGHVKGGAILALTLDSLTLNGAKYSIETREFEEVGKGRGKRTAIGGGGGAAFGAIVGALAGGGKGAAIGAVAGGGAGTAGAAYTGKRDITLPAESRLHFKLAQPLTINP